MTTGDIIVCDVRIDQSARTMRLSYRGIKHDDAGGMEPKSGEFMTLTRDVFKGKQRFSAEGQFYSEPYFDNIR